MGYPWIVLHTWQPFHIDALGLLSLLGAEEIDQCIGRLVPSRWLEYLPFVGGYVIASDRIRKKNQAFLFYNITQGIHTTDLSSWFTRWMQCQDFEITRSIVFWEVDQRPHRWWPYHIISGFLSFSLMGLLLAMTVMAMDWYGMANAAALAVMICVRAYVLQANRAAINRSVTTPKQTVKTILITPDSKVVTMFIPNNLIVPVFVRNPDPGPKWLYQLVRWIGWGAFAIHVLAIGMADLATQLYTVVLVLSSTVLICMKVGCDDRVLNRNGDRGTEAYMCWFGSQLRATVFEWPIALEFRKTSSGQWGLNDAFNKISQEELSKRRMDLYAWLNLTAEEEDSLGKWDLLPHKRQAEDGGLTWQEEFNEKKTLVRQYQPQVRVMKEAAVLNMNRKRRRSQQPPVDESEVETFPGPDPLTPLQQQRANTVLTSSGTTENETISPSAA